MNITITNKVKMVTFADISVGEAFEVEGQKILFLKCETFYMRDREGCSGEVNCFSLYIGHPDCFVGETKVFRLEGNGFTRVEGDYSG